MNDAKNGEVEPPGKWESSLVWDSTVAGGGLFGTDAQSSGRILAHTTPWTWDKDKQGAFQHLRDVHVGNSVAITTEKGRLCYNVVKLDSVLKPLLNVVYSKEKVTQGIVYLITCDRARDYGDGATIKNLVITLQLNQQQTNTGSC
ncbi:MAG: class sortase [Candidatus Saccharibacteria bacterium]|nr:class sortase [Candidatus Saccharibacteria bacterium]